MPDAADGGERYAYGAPRFDTFCDLVYAPDGFVVDYPGLAAREGVVLYSARSASPG